MSLGKAFNGIASTFWVVRLIVMGSSSTRKTKKVPSLFTDRGTLRNKWASIIINCHTGLLKGLVSFFERGGHHLLKSVFIQNLFFCFMEFDPVTWYCWIILKTQPLGITFSLEVAKINSAVANEGNLHPEAKIILCCPYGPTKKNSRVVK